MSLFSLFSIAVLAAETIISPLGSSMTTGLVTYPVRSFAQLSSSVPHASILGVATQSSELIQTVTPTPKKAIATTKKKQYTIAFLGDSMIDTLGPDLPHTHKALKSLYPSTSFSLHNFGVGATNIDYGLERIANSYTYLGKSYPSVASQNPDIVVVESFGYNPYTYETGAIDKHWMQLAAIVDSLKSRIPGVRIVIAVTIAPNSKTFGDGAAGLSFGAEDKLRRTTVIKQYLDSTVKFARSQKLPLADAYHASMDASGDGKLVYINGGDHIHYSDAGRALFARKVADAIFTNKLLE